MKLAKVVGTIVSARKEEELEGLKLLLLKDLDEKMATKSGVVVAVDAVGAGVDEVVLYASGSSARQTLVTKDRPVDAVVMAIVDQVEFSGKTSYKKDN